MRTAYERSGILKAWHALILEHEPLLAELMTVEMGKPVTESAGEVRYGAAFVEWYAEEAKRIAGETMQSQFPDKRLHAIRQPSGVVFAITPWNFPIAMVTRKIAPALAAGCVVIVKPAEQSPLSALALAALWREAGGPPDAFQVLTALDPKPLSGVLLDDFRVRVLTFTGSTQVGVELYARSARTMKRLALELGGHAPFLVFADADLDAAVREVMACKFRNGGQTCVSTNRIYVQESIATAFLERLTAQVAALRVGNPLDPSTQVGPLVDQAGVAKVTAHMRDAVVHGATVLTGGDLRSGLYYQPTVVTGIRPDMRMMREETFGPVAPVLTFATEDDALRMANGSPYGLAAYLWTSDLRRAYRVSEGLEFGIVGINDGVPSTAQAPFGGVKMSGIGREGGHWGIDEFLDIKYISVGLT
ncbi:MAG: Succinate-semialdehyde dehydrogenase [NADP(+)] [Gemmatimonadaceae bacterium]|nr:Succinate-semialdehyde dehydrogenase [NADP(+)] [Gemmatimonadaceae bacterium]